MTVQTVRDCLDVCSDPLESLCQRIMGLARPSFLSRRPSVHCLQFKPQQCDLLIDVIVKLAGDPRTLLLLRRQDSAPKIGHCQIGKLAIRDVNARSDVPCNEPSLLNLGTPVSKIHRYSPSQRRNRYCIWNGSLRSNDSTYPEEDPWARFVFAVLTSHLWRRPMGIVLLASRKLTERGSDPRLHHQPRVGRQTAGPTESVEVDSHRHGAPTSTGAAFSEPAQAALRGSRNKALVPLSGGLGVTGG